MTFASKVLTDSLACQQPEAALSKAAWGLPFHCRGWDDIGNFPEDKVS